MEEIALGILKVAAERRWDVGAGDRLVTAVTPSLLLFAAFTVSLREFALDPIQCWNPAQFDDAAGWEEYVETYCFVENTYWVGPNETLPEGPGRAKGRTVTYYQWVPFFFAFQALLFHLPVQLWSMAQRLLGESVNGCVGSAAEGGEGADSAADHLFASANLAARSRGRLSLLSAAYLLFKVGLLANIGLQFSLMKAFFDLPHLWGSDLLRALWEESHWKESGHFPRTTMCDFKVRELGSVRAFTVQCVLMVNMINEKIMIFFFWWLVLVLVVSVVSLLRELWALLVPQSSQELLFGLLGDDAARDPVRARAWAAVVLGPSEMFVFRKISANAGEVLATRVAQRLWRLSGEERRRPATRDQSQLSPLARLISRD